MVVYLVPLEGSTPIEVYSYFVESRKPLYFHVVNAL